MNKYIDPFLANVPSLDVHGYDSSGAVAEIKIFIDNYYGRLNEKKLIIVHGKGEGILRKATHNYLKSDKRVLSFKTNYGNDGETIVIMR